MDAGCDVAIGVRDLGARGSLIFSEVLVPMCSPSYLHGTSRPLSEPADLRRHTLLHIDYSAFRLELPGWPEWLRRFGVEDGGTTPGLHFDSICPALLAARDGLGIVLAPRRLMTRMVKEGHLVHAFDIPDQAEKGYFLSCKDKAAPLPKVDAFRRWVLEEAASGDEIRLTP